MSDIVLDFACGSGIKTVEIAGNAREICAIYTSQKMVEVAKKRAARRPTIPDTVGRRYTLQREVDPDE